MAIDVVNNINQVRNRIQKAALVSGRQASDITLVAVTKTVDCDTAHDCFKAGISDLAENRVQELEHKIACIPQARWHLIGRLQTNKVKDIVGKVCLIHSLDSWHLAEEINKRYLKANIPAPVLIQVNISGEQQKAGINPGDVESFLDSVGQLGAIRVNGLMTIAPQVENPEQTRPVFKELYNIKNKMLNKKFKNVDLEFLSMGMSQDFDIAIEEGANIVRIGSAIFKDTNNLV